MVLLPDCKCCGGGGPPCDVCLQGYRVSGYPFSQYVCKNGDLLTPGFVYPDLFIEGDISKQFEVVLLEDNSVLYLEDVGKSGFASVTAVGYCKSGKGDLCRSAYAQMNLKPFPALVLPDGNTYDMGDLVIQWNKADDSRSAVITGESPGTPPNSVERSNCFMILRSMSIGGVAIKRPIGGSTLYDDFREMTLFAENGQDSQMYMAACVQPENWTGPLSVTIEVWSYGTEGLPPVYELIESKSFKVHWDQMHTVAQDCVSEPCQVLPVSSCFYKDYEFDCKEYTNADELTEIENEWKNEFNRNLGGNSLIRCDTFYGRQVPCGECCGGFDPSLEDGVTGHSLFNAIDETPVLVGDVFPGDISGSLVNSLTPLKCVSVTPTEILFEDSPPVVFACNPYQWEECPPFGGPCTEVDGFACFFLDPYRPNDPNAGGPEFDSCEECRASCGSPMWPGDGDRLCLGETPQDSLTGYTARILLDKNCRASSTNLSFPDVRPFYDDGSPENIYPSILTVQINSSGVLIKAPQPSTGIVPVQIAATFGGVTVGSRPIESSLTTISFRYCPLDAYGLVENPDAITAYRYIPQDDFSGPLSITLTDYRAANDGSETYTVNIDIAGAYDSYCWLCGKDLFGDPLVSKPTNEPVYEAGNNARPVSTTLLNQEKTMPTTKTTTGPGTELSNMLASWGFKESAKCSCKKMSRLMDGWGAACATEPHLTTIVDHLQKEAKKRKLPFVRTLAKALVLRAVRRSENQS